MIAPSRKLGPVHEVEVIVQAIAAVREAKGLCAFACRTDGLLGVADLHRRPALTMHQAGMICHAAPTPWQRSPPCGRRLLATSCSTCDPGFGGQTIAAACSAPCTAGVIGRQIPGSAKIRICHHVAEPGHPVRCVAHVAKRSATTTRIVTGRAPGTPGRRSVSISNSLPWHPRLSRRRTVAEC